MVMVINSQRNFVTVILIYSQNTKTFSSLKLKLERTAQAEVLKLVQKSLKQTTDLRSSTNGKLYKKLMKEDVKIIIDSGQHTSLHNMNYV